MLFAVRCAFRYGRPLVQGRVSLDDHRQIFDDMLRVPVRDQQPSRTVLTVLKTLLGVRLVRAMVLDVV